VQEKLAYNYYGLPEKVNYCKKCVQSNQAPTSVPEFRHTINRKKPTVKFDKEGICDSCRYVRIKNTEIDWSAREKGLVELLDKYRRKDGYYDVLVPGSGGKDSVRVSYELKYKYGMRPLTVTWPPHIYTDIGWKNFRKWIDKGGFDNVTFNPNGKVHRLLTRLAVENIFHPFQPFTLGQKYLASKMALKFDIKLVFYGENTAEYVNPIKDNFNPQQDKKYYAADIGDLSSIYVSGLSVAKLISDHGLTLNDLEPYMPPDRKKLIKEKIDVRYMGYYLKWLPRENYEYSLKHTGFEANPERTEGTYTKYCSLDDKIDGLHYWTTFIKFGYGRASHDAAHEVREGYISRDEAIRLVHRYDGEFPKKYFKQVLEYTDMSKESFFKLTDKFRSPHLWKKVNGQWRLRYQVT